MSTQTNMPNNEAIVVDTFPNQQSAIVPGAGTGGASLYLAGSPGATRLNVYLGSGGGNVQVFYGENFQSPTTPLPQGITTFSLNNGFNIRWISDGTPFKVVGGVS
jgi:hypothetical protein